ncbi:MAG TPA: cation transporter [Dehalococcoidia bacterium]|nr:cation transporter [Dehalococcoidia bacterium]
MSDLQASDASQDKSSAPDDEIRASARARLRERGFMLEYLTIGWNVFEGMGAIVAGLVAGSVALVAFGLDSTVEVFASSIVVWELRGASRERERRALRLIGGAYLVVASYVLWDAGQSLLAKHRAGVSPAGILLMVATVAIMLGLAIAKRRIGTKLLSQTVLADANFSFIDAALSTTVLAGLVLNALLGWWWADQTLAILLAGLAAREGIEALRR